VAPAPAAGGVRAGADALPVGRVVAIRGRAAGAEVPGAVSLQPGLLRDTLVVAGAPLGELAPGTRLRVGDAALLEVEAAPAAARREGGLCSAPDGPRVPARVVAAGTIRAGDRVVVEAVRVPVEDALDLHPFRPEEIADVVREYLDAARAAGFAEVRLIHGRGRGVQRETVRRVLAGSSLVAGFADAPPERGGWGATVVRLRAAR